MVQMDSVIVYNGEGILLHTVWATVENLKRAPPPPPSLGDFMTQYLPCVENRVDRSQKDVRCALPDSPALHPPPHRVRVTGALTGHPRVRRMVHNGGS